MREEPTSVNGTDRGLPALRRRLHRLHRATGGPTYRQLYDQASLAGLHLPTSTAQELLTGRGQPRWTTIEAFVVASVGHARSRRPPLEVPNRLDDLRSWRRWYEQVNEVTAGPRATRSRPPPSPDPGPDARATHILFVLAVDAAHNALRGVARSRAHLPSRIVAANRAVDDSALYAERERLLATGAPAVVSAGERLFLRLIAVRDAIRTGATLESVSYHRVYHPFAEALWAFRMAVRVDLGQPPLTPRQLDRDSWRDHERCPECAYRTHDAGDP